MAGGAHDLNVAQIFHEIILRQQNFGIHCLPLKNAGISEVENTRRNRLWTAVERKNEKKEHKEKGVKAKKKKQRKRNGGGAEKNPEFEKKKFD